MQQLRQLEALDLTIQKLIKDIASTPTWKSKLFGGLCAVVAGGFLTNYAIRPDNPFLSVAATYIDKTDVANPITHTEVTNLDPVAAGVFAVMALAVFAWAWYLHKNAQNAQQTLKSTHKMDTAAINTYVKYQKCKDEEASCSNLFIGCFR